MTHASISSRRRSLVVALVSACLLSACGEEPSVEEPSDEGATRSAFVRLPRFTYSAEDIGEVNFMVAMNNGAETSVVGDHHLSILEDRGFVFDRVNGVRDLRPFDRQDFTDPKPSAINDAGSIVGDTIHGAAVLSTVGRPSLLPALDVGDIRLLSSVKDINNVAVAVGSTERLGNTETNTSIPTRWRLAAVPPTVEALEMGGTPSPFLSGEATAVNDAGTVVGQVNNVPVIFRDGQAPQRLPVERGVANDISSTGYVTGSFGLPGRAYVFTPAGRFQAAALPALLVRSSVGNAVNFAGHVVGAVVAFWGGPRAYLWTSDGTAFVDLNDVTALPDGVVLTEAVDINDRGVILCEGTVSGRKHGFLLRRIPLFPTL